MGDAKSPGISPLAERRSRTAGVQGVPQAPTLTEQYLMHHQAFGNRAMSTFLKDAMEACRQGQESGYCAMYSAPMSYQRPPYLPPQERAGLPEKPTVGDMGAAVPAVGHGQRWYLSEAPGRSPLYATMDFGSGASGDTTDASPRAALAAVGATRGDGAHLSHQHTDHVNKQGVEVRRQGLLPADFFMDQTMVRTRGREMTRQANALSSDLGPQWLGNLGKPLFQPYLNPGVQRFVVQHGTVIVEGYSTTDAQRNLATGEAKYVDGGAPLRVITQLGTGRKFIDMNDLRGRDLLALRDAMGSDAFAELFRGADTLFGFQHHLGVVNDRRDVAGIIAVLDVARSALGQVRVVVQTDDAQMRDGLVAMLERRGVAVTAMLEGTDANPTFAVVRPGQDLETQGTALRQGTANRRAQRLENRVQRVDALERYLRAYGEDARARGVDPAALLARLEPAIRAVRDAQTALNDETLGRLPKPRGESATPTVYQDNIRPNEANVRAAEEALKARLSAVESQVPAHLRRAALEMSRLEGAADRYGAQLALDYHLQERTLDADHGLNASARLRPEERSDSMTQVLRGGYRPAQTRDLVAVTGVAYARDAARSVRQEARSSADPLQRAEAIKQQREAFRAQLQAQADLMTVTPSKTALLKSTSAEAGVELVQLAQQTLQREGEIRNNNVTASFLTLLWWLDKGVMPPFRGIVDRWFREDEGIDDLGTLFARLQEGRLAGVEIGALTDEADWRTFEEWVNTQILTFDDFQRHFGENRATGVRWWDGQWQMATWTWGDWMPANVKQRWVTADRLTALMNSTMKRVWANTQTELDNQWSSRTPVRGGGEGEPVIGLPVAKRRFKQERFVDRNLYGVSSQIAIFFGPRWGAHQPVFMELKAEGVPEGYVMVTGADARTWALMRETTHYVPDVREPVLVKKGDKSPEVEAARRLHAQGQARFDASVAGEGHTGAFRFGGLRPNYHAVALVKADSLGPRE